jgi:hypothetical protein
MLTRKIEGREVEDYCGWSLRDRLELLAFDARLAGVPPALLEALGEAIDLLDGLPGAGQPQRPSARVQAGFLILYQTVPGA